MQELKPEQERLSCDPAHAARAEEFREGNEQMDRQEEQIAHKLKLSRWPICTRLHHSGDSRQNLPIRHPQVAQGECRRNDIVCMLCAQSHLPCHRNSGTVVTARRLKGAPPMECPSCHKVIPDDSKFCLGCGVALSARCSSCGHANPVGAKFCLECGQKL